MLNLSALKNSFVFEGNMNCSLVTNLIRPPEATELKNAYPTEGFDKCIRDQGSQKHYSFGLLNLVLNHQIQDHAKAYASQLWFDLAHKLLAKDYIVSLSQHLKINLYKTKINLGLYRFDQGDWVAPHVDNEDKILTQIFYFNDHWATDWGGAFHLLNSNDADKSIFNLAPFINFTVLLVRSDTAWHMVTPVTSKAQYPRLSMQLEFIRD